ncbi:hypothetical protein CspHIS471_0100580 [Cutaneotrichosporon sp. HIS471]|nr:hypothetical protein CspHIS471_0100580 [Cutaneotrichosporon sp. HIS471]
MATTTNGSSNASSNPKPKPKPASSKPAQPHPNTDPLYPFFFFYGHTPSNPIGALSQWHAPPFVDDGKTFQTAEHYMMYHKAMLFDPVAAQEILDAKGPNEAKALGREITNFDPEVWETLCDGIVERGNYLKFTQNPHALGKVLTRVRVRIVAEQKTGKHAPAPAPTQAQAQAARSSRSPRSPRKAKAP